MVVDGVARREVAQTLGSIIAQIIIIVGQVVNEFPARVTEEMGVLQSHSDIFVGQMVQGVVKAGTGVDIVGNVACLPRQFTAVVVNIGREMGLTRVGAIVVVLGRSGESELVPVAQTEVKCQPSVNGLIVGVSPSFASSHGEVGAEVNAVGDGSAGSTLD